jgi:hypothetical protein
MMPPVDDELRARIYSLPTRGEFEAMLDRFVTKEIFNLEIKNLRDEVLELQERPANHRAMWAWIAGIAITMVSVLGFLAQHIVWR